MTVKTGWRRMQVLLSTEQYHALRAAAALRRVSMGELVREALSKELELPSVEARVAAADRLARMNEPVSDWPQMAREIEEGRFQGYESLP